MKTPKNPMQPMVKDDNNVVRFKENEIVRYLLDHGGIDMNALATLSFTQDDRQQFAQLIGYSLAGFHELSYVPDTAAALATGHAKAAGFADASGCRDHGCGIHSGVKETTGKKVGW